MTAAHGRGHLIRAILEGVAFSLRDSLEIFRELEIPVNEIRVSGGCSRSLLWRQIQADVYGCDVHTLNSTEGPAFGVALLAQVGTGGFASVPEACDATIRLDERTPLDPHAQRFYDRGYELYRRLYTSLKGSFAEIGALVEWSRS